MRSWKRSDRFDGTSEVDVGDYSGQYYPPESTWTGRRLEYMCLRILDVADEKVTEQLNHLGQQGWVVQFSRSYMPTSGRMSEEALFLMREVQE